MRLAVEPSALASEALTVDELAVAVSGVCLPALASTLATALPGGDSARVALELESALTVVLAAFTNAIREHALGLSEGAREYAATEETATREAAGASGR